MGPALEGRSVLFELREAPSSCVGRSEFEEWVASSLGGVLRERVIDADPQPPKDADGWPKAWPEQRTNDARPPEPLECAPEHSSPFLGRELDGLHRCATAVRMDDGGLAVRPKVGDPADLAVGGLHEPATVELDHANRHCSNPAGPPTAHREEHVRSTGREPGRYQPADDRIEQAEKPPGYPIPDIQPGGRAMTIHKLTIDLCLTREIGRNPTIRSITRRLT
jgi:hypothetical protein